MEEHSERPRYLTLPALMEEESVVKEGRRILGVEKWGEDLTDSAIVLTIVSTGTVPSRRWLNQIRLVFRVILLNSYYLRGF